MRFGCQPAFPRLRRVIDTIVERLFLVSPSVGNLLDGKMARIFEVGMGEVGMRNATGAGPCAVRPGTIISATGHMRPGAMISAAAMPSATATMTTAAATAAMTTTAAATAAMTTAAAAATTTTCRNGQGDGRTG
jgi:hypothetical protein